MSYLWLFPVVRDLVLIFVAVCGLTTWKRQLHGQSKYDIAKRLLMSLYLFREAITNARCPIVEYYAVPDLPKEKLETLSAMEKEWHSKVQAYEKRWSPMAKAQAELDINMLESEVFWGNEIKDKIQPLRRLRAELHVAIEDHLERTNPNNHDKTYSYSGDDCKKNRAIIYGKDDRAKDPFLNKMLTAIEAIEAVLKPCINKRGWMD